MQRLSVEQNIRSTFLSKKKIVQCNLLRSGLKTVKIWHWDPSARLKRKLIPYQLTHANSKLFNKMRSVNRNGWCWISYYQYAVLLTNTTFHFLFSWSWSKTALTSTCFNTIVMWLQLRSNSHHCMNSYKFNTMILKPYLRSFTKIYSQEEMMMAVSDNLFFQLKAMHVIAHFPLFTH